MQPEQLGRSQGKIQELLKKRKFHRKIIKTLNLFYSSDEYDLIMLYNYISGEQIPYTEGFFSRKWYNVS